jgi:4-hydroxymandelate oxidase
MSDNILSRRQLLGGIGAVVAGAAYAQAPQGAKPAAPGTGKPAVPAAAPRPRLTIDSGPRMAPVDEIVLVQEFADSARQKLSPAAFSAISGTDHRASDRMTLRPRMMIPTLDMDLSVPLFGDTLFTSIVIGATPEQRRFHADAELGTVRGAAAGKAAVVISSRSSVPIGQIMAEAKTPVWFEVGTDAEAKGAVTQAAKAGVRAIIVNVAGAPGAAAAEPDWAAVDGLREGLNVPLVVRGIMTVAAAKTALGHGVQGIIVSDAGNTSAPMLVLASIVDAVAGKVPVLMQGSVRFGADVVKAHALGAKAVLVGRPAVWALAGYGAIGVQTLVELLQADFARTMGMMGNSTPASLTRRAVTVHRAV